MSLQIIYIYVSVNSQHLTVYFLHSIQYQKGMWKILVDREVQVEAREWGEELSQCLSFRELVLWGQRQPGGSVHANLWCICMELPSL